MLPYALRRLIALAFTTVFTLSAVFLALRVVPGDAAVLRAGLDATPATLAATRHALGLDRSLGAQYLGWLGGLAHGDLGQSSREGRPVLDIVGERLEVTLWLTALSLALGVALGLALGLLLVRTAGGGLERGLTGILQAVLAAPPFWVGLLLALVFSGRLGWLPLLGFEPLSSGFGPWASHLALPVVTLALPRAAYLALWLRAGLLEEAGRDHLRTGLAKGLSPARLRTQALKAVGPGLVTVLALQLGGLLGGAIIVEGVFNLPGLGLALLGAVSARDYPLVQGLSVLALAAYGLLNLLADLLAARLDPRVRYG